MIETAPPRASSQGKRTWLQLFKPAPPAPVMLSEPTEVQREYKVWQRRILISSLIGYACFYLVRKNLGFAMPALERAGITKSSLGLFLTLHGVIYGISKFTNGFLADRANARTFMVVALVLSAITNIFFGLSSAVMVLGSLWMVNGWFQGMGFPPCARLMTHWFSPKELATKMSIWNTSHSIGGGFVAVLCGYLAMRDWRLCFLVPAAIALAGAVYLGFTLRDTPQSVGLPEVAGTEQGDSPTEQTSAEFKAFLKKQVFENRYIWLFALANFFVYVVRYAIVDWGATLLGEAKGVKLAHAGWMIGAFEISGVVGMLLGGWITDKWFGGRGARTCVFCMFLTGLSVFAFWKVPGEFPTLSTAALCLCGFFLYAPQALVGITVANLATKRAAATAVGFTGFFGYLSTTLSGWGLGKLVQHQGWNMGLGSLVAASLLGMVLFAAAWNAKADGYADLKSRNPT
jgi:sugar phosphate permease